MMALLACPLAITASEESGNSRPNVLFILIDDFGWTDVDYNGSSFYETPHMDALASQWMRFDNCYTPSPMCSPTRTSILTGKNPARHGVTQWLPGVDRAFGREGEDPHVYCATSQSTGIAENETTLGEAFQQAGYKTAFHGKWHMGKLAETGGPMNHGYDSEKAIIQENRCAQFFPFRDQPQYFPDAKEGDYFSDLLTDTSIEFVTRKRDQPFYLHLAYFSMHAPIKSKPEWKEHFEAKAAKLPMLEEGWETEDPYSHKPYKLRQDDPEYAGQLAALDANIGRLTASLKEAGLYDNTIIILTGDNGGRSCAMQGNPTSNAPYRTGKTFVFEGGIKTPLMIHWPEHTEAGDQSSSLISSMDFYPTLLEMTDLPARPEQYLDGKSFTPQLQGQAQDRGPLYWHFPHYQGEGSYPASAIRVGDYKLIHNYHHGDNLLYDLKSDPAEAHNLAKAMPERARKMHRQLMDYLAAVGAAIPQPLPGA